MKLYADSVNFVYFPGNETLQSEFEHEIVASSHPATPRTVSCISEFLACIQPQQLPPMANEVPFESIPDEVDCLVVGAGIAGLLLASELIDLGKQVLLLEKSDGIGGVWCHQANAGSRVNTSEGAYRLLSKARVNTDHTPTQQIMEDSLRNSHVSEALTFKMIGPFA